jgi:single-strand DNA-binding protein
MSERADHDHRNDVVIVGAVSSEPQVRTLPSGDEIVVCRVTVRRPGTAPGGPGHDTIDCTAWTARPQATLGKWRVGDLVEVEGALRRRFYRVGSVRASTYGVDVTRARRRSAALTRPRTRG